MGKYKTLQLDTKIHAQLQDYCNERDLRMSKFVQRLIDEKINPKTVRVNPSKILKTHPILKTNGY